MVVRTVNGILRHVIVCFWNGDYNVQVQLVESYYLQLKGLTIVWIWRWTDNMHLVRIYYKLNGRSGPKLRGATWTTWTKKTHFLCTMFSVAKHLAAVCNNENNFVLVCLPQSVTWSREKTMWRWMGRCSLNPLWRNPSVLKTTTSTSTTPPQREGEASASSERSHSDP